jgi:hypothetical protein
VSCSVDVLYNTVSPVIMAVSVRWWPTPCHNRPPSVLRKDDENRIQAAEMWFYRSLLRVKWTEKRTNESVLKELGVQRLSAFTLSMCEVAGLPWFLFASTLPCSTVVIRSVFVFLLRVQCVSTFLHCIHIVYPYL